MLIRQSCAWGLPICALVGSSLLGCQATERAETSQEHYGWDCGLTHHCVSSPHPQAPNYFEDRSDCPIAGKRWTVAVQSETTSKGYGPTDQSFPINVGGSPVSLDWVPFVGKGCNLHQSVRLTTNFETVAHPGGKGYFTWFVLMDHTAYGGGPFPRPDELLSKVTVTFDDATPNGATRAFVGFTGVWDGKMHGVEVCFALANWGDNDPAEDVISVVNNDSLEFVLMDGAPMGIIATRGQETRVEIAWHKIVQGLVCRGYFKPPQNGWEQAQTAAIYVGTEVNNFTASGAARATLSMTDFRIERARVVMPRL